MSEQVQRTFLNTLMRLADEDADVRRQAMETMAVVCPEGHTTRVILSFAYRALHP